MLNLRPLDSDCSSADIFEQYRIRAHEAISEENEDERSKIIGEMDKLICLFQQKEKENDYV